jgi:signal transduction histidine kinase
MTETGTNTMTQSDLPASRNNLLIQYTGIDFHDAHQLRYQYELEGVDADWSAPTEQMAVNYARLAPGVYRFLVRAVNEDGLTSLQPAVLQFRILPPLWQRWWFILVSITAACLLAYAIYRYRVARLIELERVRTRIASDLHDDIGANLSLLAGLSEMLNQQAQVREPQMSEWLSVMASVSRRSVDAMSDIVWAVNPNKDHLRDLVQRMRRFASDAFTAHNMEYRFETPGTAQDVKLGAEMRREVFLVFKEAVNNTARHSGCTHAAAVLAVERGWLTLEVRDDGCGFDPTRADSGEGLVSMGQRARKLGGTLTVLSHPGGTSIKLKVPLQ